MRSSSPRKLSWIARSSHRLSSNLSLSSLLEPGCHPGFLTDPSLRALAPRRPPRSPPLGTGNMLHKYYARNRWESDEWCKQVTLCSNLADHAQPQCPFTG